MTAQALPDSYPNLAQLFQAAPLMGFAQAGDQQAIADQNNPRLQQAFDQDQAQLRVMNPLMAAYQGAQTRHLDASSGLLGAQTTGANQANNFTAATQPGKIDSTNAGYSATGTKDRVGQMEDQGRMFGQVAAQLRALPDDATPWERANLVKQAMGPEAAKYPGLDQMLTDNHGTLADRLDALSKDSYNKSTIARRDADNEKRRLAMIDAQGQNALELEAAKASDRIELSRVSASFKPKPAESMTQYEARIRQGAASGDAGAQAALTALLQSKVALAQAGQDVNDTRIRELLNGGIKPKPSTPTLPQPVSAPPVASQGPSQGGSDPAAIAMSVANGPPLPEGALDPIVAKMPEADRKVFVKELWVQKAMKSNPGMSRAEIEAEGKKRNKF